MSDSEDFRCHRAGSTPSVLPQAVIGGFFDKDAEVERSSCDFELPLKYAFQAGSDRISIPVAAKLDQRVEVKTAKRTLQLTQVLFSSRYFLIKDYRNSNRTTWIWNNVVHQM